MTALAAARNTPRKAEARRRSLPLPANGKIWQGGMAQINAAGYLVPASATVANVTVGMARESVDNTGGANGDKSAEVERGTFYFNNSASGDLIARTEIGKNCYVVDDQTVAKTDSSGTRPVAGKVYDVDAGGVWVEF